MIKATIFILLLLCPIGLLRAENFTWKASLDSIHVAGYYKIPLSPEIVAELRNDEGDIRLVDNHQQVIPYLLFVEKSEVTTSSFHTYTILENSYNPTKFISRIVVHNPGRKLLSGFKLVVRNTSIEKEITLKGSENQKDWFIIQRELPVRYPASAGESTETRTLEFPESNYAYFELTMNEKKGDPIHIISVGSTEAHAEKGLYTEVPSPQITVSKTSEKGKSQLILTFSKPYEISMLELNISTGGMYFRQAEIGMEVLQNKLPYYTSLTTFDISSGKSHLVRFEPIRTKKLILTISNGDNSPLQISSVRSFQLSRYLVASLKPGMDVTLLFGDKQTGPPTYDMTHFSDSIPSLLPEVAVKTWIPLPKKAPAKSFVFFNATILWVVIGIVIFVLGFYSIRMIREMKE